MKNYSLVAGLANPSTALLWHSYEEGGRKRNTGRVLYLHYPNYMGGFEGDPVLSKLFPKAKFPVGHNAVITVSPSNVTRYYEYGRYKEDPNIVGKTERRNGKEIFGNVRRFRIPNKNNGETDSAYVERVKHFLPYSRKSDAIVQVIPANTDSVNAAFQRLADDPGRKAYSLNPLRGYVQTCATMANDMIARGLSGRQKSLAKGVAVIKAVRHAVSPLQGVLLDPVYDTNDSVPMKTQAYSESNPFASGRYFKQFKPLSVKNFRIRKSK